MSISNSELVEANAIEDRDLESAIVRTARRERLAVLAMRIAFIVAVLAVWEISIRVGFAQELLIGQPSRIAHFLAEMLVGGESRPRKSGQDDRWSFCLTAGTLCPSNQEIR